MKLRLFTLILILLVIGGCLPQSSGGNIVSNEHFSSEGISILIIEMGAGKLAIDQSASEDIQISSTTEDLNAPAITKTGNVLQIDFQKSTSKNSLSIELPDNIELVVNSFNCDIQLESIQSDINIRNTAGDIYLLDVEGISTLWAGRGNITIKSGQGKVVAIGEHGFLNVADFSGEVIMTTIMGEIIYQGKANRSDSIQLEADHGPITAILPASTNYKIEINSAGGEIVCHGGNLARTPNRCEGSTGSGGGEFKIRSVSGRIEFQIQPGSVEENND